MTKPRRMDLNKEEGLEEEMWQAAFGEGANEESKANVVREGYAPTAQEVKQHMVNHLPFRSWCRHCVKGKAKGLPHRLKKKEDKEAEQVPLVSVDYMFRPERLKAFPVYVFNA